MLKIGLVGIDTWHTNAYTRIFNGNAEAAPIVNGARITHVWAGNNANAPEKLAEAEREAGAPYEKVVDDASEMIGAVDGVIVIDVDRHGEHHPEFARPFIEAGVPTFVDKPLALNYAEASELFDLAAMHETPLMSCSALRFPVELDREAVAKLGTLSAIVSVGPGEWFDYGIHAVEAIGAVTDATPLRVTRQAFAEKDIATIEYEGGLIGTVMTLRDAEYVFHMSIYGEHGMLQFRIDDADGFYRNCMQAYAEMVRTGRSPLRAEQTLAVLGILAAGEISAAEDRTVELRELTGDTR